MRPLSSILEALGLTAALEAHQVSNVGQADGESDLILFSIRSKYLIEMAELDAETEAIIIPFHAETAAKKAMLFNVIPEVPF